MRLNKKLKRVLVITFYFFVCGMLSTRGYSQVPTPIPTMTDKEKDNYYDSDPESALSDEMKREDEDIKNNKIPSRPWHSHYTPVSQPNSPTHFKVIPGDGMAHLSWDAMPRAIGYVIFVSEDGQNFQRRFRKPISKTEITIGVLQNGKTYYFAVDSVGQAGHETNKAVQSVVPLKIKTQSYLFGREMCA